MMIEHLDYIKVDDGGFPYNGIFPPEGAPDSSCWQKEYSGYRSGGEEAFMHSYAVQGYNLEFNFEGETYVLTGHADGNPIVLLDSDDKEIQRFSDPMDALRHCTIAGHRLLDIMDLVTDIECG